MHALCASHICLSRAYDCPRTGGARKARRPDLVEDYRKLLGTFPNLCFVPFDAAVADISSALRARYDLRTPDAIQVATALHRGAEEFVTNDAGQRRINEIRIALPRSGG